MRGKSKQTKGKGINNPEAESSFQTKQDWDIVLGIGAE